MNTSTGKVLVVTPRPSSKLCETILAMQEQGLEVVLLRGGYMGIMEAAEQINNMQPTLAELSASFTEVSKALQFDLPPEKPPVDSTNFLRNFGRKKGHWEK